MALLGFIQNGKWVTSNGNVARNYDNAIVQTSTFSNENAGTDAQIRKIENMVPAGSYLKDFDRFYSVYPHLEMDSYIQYAFIVRPDCNIFTKKHELTSDCSKDPFFVHMIEDHVDILNDLTLGSESEHDFIAFLVGKTEALQIPDMSIKNYSISQPYTNMLMPYAGNAIESTTGGTFDVTFREDRELHIHKFFQAWLEYIDGATRGTMGPIDKYIQYNKFDYMTSVYYFICLPDGESIVWWTKYTGAMPTNVANSDLSFNLRGQIDNRTSVPFVYFNHRPLDAVTLTDFNKNSSGDAEYVIPYNTSSLTAGNGFVGAPFITRGNKDAYYKLRWRKSSNLW